MGNPDKACLVMCLLGSSLLLAIALLHGSGMGFVNGLVAESNVSELIKQIFPVLFLLPSIQLLGLAGLGVVALRVGERARLLLMTLALLVLIDALLAVYLQAWIPAVVLCLPMVLYGVSAFRIGPE